MSLQRSCSLLLLFAVCSMSEVAGLAPPLKVSAFNIRTFGKTKMSNDTIANYIINITSRYDIVVIQEVRDSTFFALNKLWAGLNLTGPWGLTLSEPLGRTSYKEQYAFFYRTPKVTIRGTFQYNDSALDVFEREPFAVEVEYYSVAKLANNRIALQALHTKPTDTVQELQALPKAMREANASFPNAKGIIAMGDMNADCSYLSSSNQKQLEIFQNGTGFTSVIPDTFDTTSTAGTDCAYDRAIILGQGVVVSGAATYRFDDQLRLDVETTLAISDHYPIEFNLY